MWYFYGMIVSSLFCGMLARSLQKKGNLEEASSWIFILIVLWPLWAIVIPMALGGAFADRFYVVEGDEDK